MILGEVFSTHEVLQHHQILSNSDDFFLNSNTFNVQVNSAIKEIPSLYIQAKIHHSQSSKYGKK